MNARIFTFLLFIFIQFNDYGQETYHPANNFLYNQKVYINYEESGNGDTTLIFLHGFGVSLNAWNDVRKLISAPDYKMYFIDLKGFGFSSKDKNEDYSMEEQAHIIVDFINKKELKNIILIGHSFGGGVTLRTEVMNLQENLNLDIIKIIVLDPGCYLDDIPFFIKFLRNPVMNFVSLKMASPKANAKVILKKTFYNKDKITKDLVHRYSFFFGLKNYDYTLTQAADQIIPANYQELIDSYCKIQIPTLIIWGKYDEMLRPENGERLHKEIKSSTLVIVDQCAHVPQEELPEITAKLISDFIGQ